MVGSERVGDVGQPVEEAVLESKHGSGSYEGGFGEDVANNLFGATLQAWRLLSVVER